MSGTVTLDFGLEPHSCAKHVRLVMERLFEIKYALGYDAWNLREHPEFRKVIEMREGRVISNRELKNVLERGMVLGMKWDESEYRRDEDGNERPYPHVGIVIGVDPLRGPIISQQYIDTVRTDDLSNIRRLNFVPVEVLVHRDLWKD